jgi:putative hydrolase of the HAD superfamily
MTRAVFFDVDDTLVDYDTAARRSFTTVLGPDADYDAWLSLDHHARFLRGELDFQTMREQRMADFLASLDRDEDPLEMEQRRFDGLADHYVLFHDVLPCIDRLRAAGYRLGLITNNESAHQRAKIAKVGLHELFPVIVISGEVGVAKPDAAIFTLACERAGVRPDEAVHIGDNPVADALGARDAGLHAILLDRTRSAVSPLRDVTVVHALTEVPDLPALTAARDNETDAVR